MYRKGRTGERGVDETRESTTWIAEGKGQAEVGECSYGVRWCLPAGVSMFGLCGGRTHLWDSA